MLNNEAMQNAEAAIKEAQNTMKIEDFAKLIPPCLQKVQGAAFYSGRSAFEAPAAKLYVLGHNPAGSYPGTVAEHTHCVLNCEQDDWSSYLDGHPCAKCGTRPTIKSKMRLGMLHLFKKLEIAPGSCLASNLFFSSSPTSDKIERHRRHALKEECWPFHQAVINALNIQVVVCLGKDADRWVRERVFATEQVAFFFERNGRRWKSSVHKNGKGLMIVGLTHPSRAKWINPEADPTELVVKAMQGCYN